MDGEVVHGNQLFNNGVVIVDFSLHNYPSCDTRLSVVCLPCYAQSASVVIRSRKCGV